MKKHSLSAVVICCVLAQAAFAQESEKTPDFDDNIFRPIDVFSLENASGASVSPDGETILYTRNHFDIMSDSSKSELWMIDKDGNNIPLITDRSVSSPIWSPDGSKIAFVTSVDGKAQIFCYWMESGKSGPLSRLTESPSGITWSPDGSQLAFFMRIPGSTPPFASIASKPKGAKWADPPMTITKLRYRADGRGYVPEGYSHLFVLSADGGTPRQLTNGDFNHGGSVCWMSDGKSIMISANRHENHEQEPRNSELHMVDLEDRSITALTDRFGPDSSPTLSGDGKIVAYTGFDDKYLGSQNNRLYFMNADGTDSRQVTTIPDRSIGSPKWSPYHNGFLFSYADNGNTKLGLVDLNGQFTKLADNLGSNLLGRPYGGPSGFSVSNTGVIAFSITTPEHPGDLARIVGNGPVERLTNLNKDLFEYKQIGKVEEIRYDSSFDKQEIQGWVIKPPNFDPSKKYPLILEIHGGPFSNYGDRFTAELQLMASEGYVVLYTNPRGSTSYGEDFANLIHHNYPGQDYDDLISGVDALIKQGFIDENNLFVTGGSGGGVLTSWIVGKTDRFRAAVVAKPVINWYSFALTSDGYAHYHKYWFPGLPWDNLEHYMERSPISLVGNVTTPTMLLTGEQDLRTPMSESEQYYHALKLREIDTALVKIPGASHGIATSPSRLLYKVAYILKWFETYKTE